MCMPQEQKLFLSIGEPYAAGFFEAPERGLFYRFSLALRRFYEARPVNRWRGGWLYPSGLDERGDIAVQPDCAKTFNPAYGGKGTLKGFYEPLAKKSLQAAQIMLKVREQCGFTVEPSDEAITISGYTHSIPYYERVLRESLEGYRRRIAKISDADMREGLEQVLLGLKNYHARCLQQLRQDQARPELISALEQVPFRPARSLYEAIVGWNFIAYLDGLDNLGWLDEGLMPYYRGENAEPWLRELFENVTVNDGWSCSIGPKAQPLTYQCLRAVKGLCRPMMELRVTPDMPDDLWELALQTTFSGGGQPAFYNDPKVQRMLKNAYPELSEEDRMRFSGAGCTETNLAGMSNVGGIDANINLALILARYLPEGLAECHDFADFYDGFCREVQTCTEKLLADVTRNHALRAKYLPNPMRSLLIDDCIERGTDYNAGGARFNGALTAESGMINVIDSLCAVRELVYEKKAYGPEEFQRLLAAEDPAFRHTLQSCAHYGTDDPEVNALTHAFTSFFYSLFEHSRPYRGGRWLPSSHQFNRYTKEGKRVGPTPDGRCAADALCDSNAPLSGKAEDGPTAALMSAASIDQEKILGIPVYNLTVDQSYSRPVLRALIEGYFAAGGVQLQITVLDRDVIRKAYRNPEQYPDLVVRVGGYSEFYCRLTPELRKAVYLRTIYESKT